MSTDIRLGAVIVAGGLSSRMNAFKPMLPLGNSTIIRRVITTLAEAGVGNILLVTGREGDRLTEHVSDLPVTTVHNPDYATTDMFCSARIGFAKLSGCCDRIFFLPGDVPLFSAATLAAMLDKQRREAVDFLVPTHNGKKGHPVLLSAALLPTLLAFKGDGGMKAVIRGYNGRKATIEVPDPGILLDADTPEDYQRLLTYQASI